MQEIEIRDFKSQWPEMTPKEVLLVVKSQDQIERRKRMIQRRKGAVIGRITPRPIAVGLLVRVALCMEGVRVIWKKAFHEPRHIWALSGGRFLLTEINRVCVIDGEGQVLQEYRHPWFSFLHTVQTDAAETRMLVASSGFDTVLEIDLETGAETWRWNAWENGFETDSQGIYLTGNPRRYEALKDEGKPAELVDPIEYGAHGLVTSRRSAHPNIAVYGSADLEMVLISIAHNGKVLEYDRKKGRTRLVIDCLNQMPHGLTRFRQGWLITDTTAGKVLRLTDEYVPKEMYVFSSIPGKVEGAENSEWLQTAVPFGDNGLIAVDANRGIVIVDLERACHYVLPADPNWCIQDVLVL